jgi:protein TonB
MVHAIRSSSRPHPDANRIAGYAVAIAFNAALLLLLLMPMEAPPTLPTEEVFRPWFLPVEKTPPPTPPVPAQVVARQQPTMPVQQPQHQAPTNEEQVVVPDGSEVAVPAGTTPDVPTIEAPSTPLPGVRLEYASAPPPAYPRNELREGITGTVLLQVLVDVDGHPLDVQVAQSSGNRNLDRTARQQVLKRWRFRPAMQNGRAVQAIGLVPVAFTLD